MRAWQYTSTTGGIAKNLRINSSAPLPKPKADFHLVRIIATALNPIDFKPAESIPLATRLLITTPATPGIDYAGTIVTPASGSDLKPGQLVFGASGTSPLAGGALAEYNIASATATVPIPEGIDHINAAGVGVAGLTAYQSIVPYVKAGDKVFINGGSGGTGVFGIQMAKAVGCHVTTTCSTKNVGFVEGLGADRVVDYRKEGVLEALIGIGKVEGGFDHAVDNVGTNKKLMWRCHEFLKPGGKYIAVGGEPTVEGLVDNVKRKLLPRFLGGMKGNVEGFWPQPKPEDLQQIGEWMRSGKVKTVIDQKFPFEEAPQALEKLKTGRARGKIVVEVGSEFEKRTSR